MLTVKHILLSIIEEILKQSTAMSHTLMVKTDQRVMGSNPGAVDKLDEVFHY